MRPVPPCGHTAPSTTSWFPSPAAQGRNLSFLFLPRFRGRGTRRVERALGTSAALFATPALAHDGHHEVLALSEQVRHLVSQPDHLLAFAALTVLAVVGGWTWRRARSHR